MTEKETSGNLPVYIPAHKIPEEAKEEAIEVYRICKWGTINRAAFYSSYEEHMIFGTKIKEHDEDDIGYYSVSVYEKKRDAKRILTLLSRHNPASIASIGITHTHCGLTQRTKERTGQKNSHIDWWVYEDVQPQCGFSEVNVYEDT